MLECKDKEQAVFYIYRLYNLKEVEHKSLRPPVEVESLRTGGRKSSKRKKAKDGEEIKAENEDEGVEGGTTPKSTPKKRRTRKVSSKSKVEEEIGREAEEHGLPLEDVGDALEIDGVDCGSGDEEAAVVEGEFEDVMGAKGSRMPRSTKRPLKQEPTKE